MAPRLPRNEKAALLADYLQRSGFSADIVPQLSGGQLTKEDVVSTLAKYGYDSSGQQLPSTEERGAILEEDYPFANQAMGTTEVTQDTVNEILAGAIAARQEIMGGTAFPTKEQELAVQAAVADLFTDAGIGVDQSTINPYSLEGDSLGRFVDRITVVDEIVESSSSADAASSAADSSADAAAAAKAKADAAADSADSSADSSLLTLLLILLLMLLPTAVADATGGESITLEDLVAYLLDIPTGSNAASSDIDEGFGEGDGTETLIAQLEEAIATETDPLLKAKLELELAKYKNQPTETLEAEVARLEAEAESFISGNPTQIGGNTVFTTDTSGLSDDAENVTLTSGQDITIVDTGNGTPAVDGDTKILTKEEKDAAFNEVLAGVNENTVIADIISAAVEIYGDTADAVVAIANAANDANVSAEDLANATNTSIEAVNQAAATANTTINNQTTAESRAADDDGDGEDESGCTGGKIDDGAGNCVCPDGFSENDSGVCEKDTDILDVIKYTTVTGGDVTVT